MSQSVPISPSISARSRLTSALARLGPLLALIILIIVGGILDHIVNDPDSRKFLSIANFFNILRQNSFIGIVALGMTFVIILGGIDLAVGSVVAFSGGLAIMAMNQASTSQSPQFAIAIAIFMALGIGSLCGWLHGVAITKGRITPFIATLGGMAIWRSATLTMSGAGEIRSAVPSFGAIGSGGFNLPLPQFLTDQIGVIRIANPVLAFFILAIIGALVLRRTTYGVSVYAIGGNSTAALYSGLKVDRLKIITYSLCGLFCGIAALFNASRLDSVSSSGTGVLYELDAIAAVVVGGASMAGGRGRMLGTVIGVLILGVVNNMLNMIGSPDAIAKLGLHHIGLANVNIAHLQGLVKGVIVIAAVLVQRGRIG